MNGAFSETMLLTFKLAFLTTLLLSMIGLPVAYWVAYTRSRVRPFVEALVSMPLVLPPSVLGFYLLLAFGPDSAPAMLLERLFDIKLVFSFYGILVGSLVFSLPFMVHPLQSGFASIPRQLIDASYTLGKSRGTTLFRVLLPNMRSSILTGIVLTFAHTIGEFGVVLMIGGNIPGETRLASLAIYDEVESLNYAVANQYALFLFIISFIVLLFIYAVNRKMIRSL